MKLACALWADHRFALGTANVEALLAERGMTVSRESVRTWVNRFGRHFAACMKRDRPAAADKWHLDEAVVSINGIKKWLSRAVDANGDVLAHYSASRVNVIRSPANHARPYSTGTPFSSTLIAVVRRIGAPGAIWRWRAWLGVASFAVRRVDARV